MANERVSPFHCPGPEMVNRNLLDNWYFLNPVNQRGQTAYEGNGYCIDRWYKVGNAVTLTTEGITMYDGVWPDQYIDGGIFEGDELTFTVLTPTKLYTVTGKAGKDESIHINAPSGWCSFYYSTNKQCYAVNLATNIGASITIVAAKLEHGPVQTLAHLDSTGKWVLNEIPNYVEELNKCRYYYRVFDTEEQRTANNWGMRLANPTAGTISIDGGTKYTLDANL